MPFKSKAQMKLMFAKDPAMAKQWASETPNIKDLPFHKNKNLSEMLKGKKRG